MTFRGHFISSSPMQALYTQPTLGQAELRPETPIVINHFYKIASNLIDIRKKIRMMKLVKG